VTGVSTDDGRRHLAQAKGRWRSGAVVAGLALALVLVMHRPTFASLVNTLPGDLGDPTLAAWILSWEAHALVSEPSRFFDGNMFHPYGEAIKYAEMMLPLLPFFAIIYWLSGQPVFAYNLVVLGLAVLCFVTTYLLAKRLTDAWTAVVAAVSFTFSGFVFMHQSHLQLLTLGFFPLAFLALFNALERRRTADGVWLGLCTALLTMSAVYYGAIWFICLIVVIAVDLVRIRRPDKDWWRTLISAGVVVALLVGPYAYVYASFQSRIPYVRSVDGLGLNPIDFLTPAPGSVVYAGLSRWATARQPTGVFEHGFFIGFVIMALALGGAILITRSILSRKERGSGSRARYEISLLAAAGAVSMLLAIGPEVLGLPMPFRLLQSWVPGFDKLRPVSRLAVPALLAAAMLAAWCLQRLLSRSSPELKRLAVGLVASAVLLEMWVTPLKAEVPAPEPIRQLLLAEDPQGAVLELPMRQTIDPRFPFVEGPRLLASIGDWRPRFNGYSGGLPPEYPADVQTLSQFASAPALERVDELGIRYVILHGAETPTEAAYSFAQVDDILGSFPDGSSIIRAGDDWLIDLDFETATTPTAGNLFTGLGVASSAVGGTSGSLLASTCQLSLPQIAPTPRGSSALPEICPARFDDP
jgi:4-amino-4-deoxy-L-arabinose transferase-like glycosyltransferase